MIKINSAKCPQNHKCPLVDICPVGAISQEGNSLPKIDTEKCIVCGQCVTNCLQQAIDFE